ncbi:hypothetical protein BC833DRAFT_607348, partial [Globomyces pollinis-pini]
MFKFLIFTFKITNAQIVFQSTWKYTECQGLPITMQIFNETNPTQIYTDVNELIVLPVCASDPIPMDTGCCISTLTNAYTYQSFTFQYIDENNRIIFPKSALNGLYCHLEYEIDGFYPNYLLASSQCVEKLTCSKEGMLSIYADDECQDALESYELIDKPIEFINSSIGIINASLYRIDNTNELFDIQWTAYHPGTILVPNFQSPMEIIALICTIFSTLTSAYSIYHYGSHYQLKKRWNSLNNMLIHICWFCSCILYIFYWCIAYEFEFQYLIVLECYGILINIATLLTAYDTLLTILHFFHINSKVKTNAISILLVMVHIGLAGTNYILYVIGSADIDENIRLWAMAVPIWNYILHIMNTFPPIYMLLMYSRILSMKTELSVQTSLYTILKKNMYLTLAIFGQLINFGTYCLLTYIASYTQLLGNERNVMANTLMILCCQVIHSLINGALMEQLRMVSKTFQSTVQSSKT